MNKRPILYIKPGCPWCRAARSFLEQHGLDLDIRNVLANKKDMDQMTEISGQTMTPTFQYGDFVVADFSVDEFMAEIAEFPELQAELGIGDDE